MPFQTATMRRQGSQGSCVRASSVLAGETVLSLCLVRCDMLAGNKVRLWGQEGKELDSKGSTSPLKISMDQAIWRARDWLTIWCLSNFCMIFIYPHNGTFIFNASCQVHWWNGNRRLDQNEKKMGVKKLEQNRNNYNNETINTYYHNINIFDSLT